MHYIRLLRPPTLTLSRADASLKLILTITTDLGESFLCPDSPVGISVVLETETEKIQNEDDKGAEDDAVQTALAGDERGSLQTERQLFALTTLKSSRGKSGDAFWRSGMRVLKIDVPLSKDATAQLLNQLVIRKQICISAADRAVSATTAQQIVTSGKGLVVPLWVEMPAVGEEFPHVAIRKLCVGGENAQSPIFVEVEEDIGESIARHIWDAGLVTVAFLAGVCMEGDKGHHAGGRLTQILKDLLVTTKHLHLLELGSGVGILGIGLAAVLTHFQKRTPKTNAEKLLLLTDLPEAEERAVSNMERSHLSVLQSHGDEEARDDSAAPTHLHLEYENLDWEDGCRGSFGPKVAAGRPWDVAMLSDCTYNVDMLPALVQTLSALHASSPTRRVLLARKPRHSSEEALFALLADEGWKQEASTTLPLPVLGGGDELIEIYLYGKEQ